MSTVIHVYVAGTVIEGRYRDLRILALYATAEGHDLFLTFPLSTDFALEGEYGPNMMDLIHQAWEFSSRYLGVPIRRGKAEYNSAYISTVGRLCYWVDQVRAAHITGSFNDMSSYTQETLEKAPPAVLVCQNSVFVALHAGLLENPGHFAQEVDIGGVIYTFHQDPDAFVSLALSENHATEFDNALDAVKNELAEEAALYESVLENALNDQGTPTERVQDAMRHIVDLIHPGPSSPETQAALEAFRDFLGMEYEPE